MQSDRCGMPFHSRPCRRPRVIILQDFAEFLVRNESYGRLIGDKIDLEHEASSWGGRSATGVDASFGCTLGGGRDVVPPSKRWAHENLGIKLYTLLAMMRVMSSCCSWGVKAWT